MEKDENLPIGALTIGEFRKIIREELEGSIKEPSKAALEKRYVYGLRGIQQLFGVSHKTAQVYKDGILKEAVYQNGRHIVTDADLAMELYRKESRP